VGYIVVDKIIIHNDGKPGCVVRTVDFYVAVADWDIGITYGALKEGKVSTAMGFATDGRVLGFNLVNLIDDKKFHPVYNVAANVRADTLKKYPELEDIFAEITPYMDNENMTRLNAMVDLAGMEPEEVAREFLIELGLID